MLGDAGFRTTGLKPYTPKHTGDYSAAPLGLGFRV